MLLAALTGCGLSQEANEDQRRKWKEHYYANISLIDEGIGKIVAALDANGAMDCTHVQMIANLEFHHMDLFGPAAVRIIRDASAFQRRPECSVRILVGMHLCGALSPRIIDLFLGTNAHGLVVCPCCLKGELGAQVARAACHAQHNALLCSTLANLLNEAAILTGRRGKDAITLLEIDDSVDRIVAGMEGTRMTDGKAKSLVAYHEVGHAICGTLTPGHDAVQKVTLVPRGQAKGLTWFLPGEDPSLISKQQIFARVVGALGGRAAEEVIFGSAEVTTGASGDLQQVASMAKQMVTTFGMSDVGPWALNDPSSQGGDMIMRMMARNAMSEQLANDIDVATKRIADEAYVVALDQIRDNREAIDLIVEELLETETMTGERFRELLGQYVTIPEENIPKEIVMV